MEEKERKIKAIIEELERLCPKTGARNSMEMLDGFVRIIKSHHGQGDAWLVSVGGDERLIHEEVLRDRPELAEFYYRLLSLGVQSQSLDEIIKWGQDAATFGVTPAIYYELLTKIENVSLVQPPAPDESENARMRNALLDIEDDAHTKSVLGLPLNVRSILMSARHGLGIDSELLRSESVADERDENGLENALSWKFFEQFAKHFVEETSFDGSQVRPVMDFNNWQNAIKKAWKTRAHAPIKAYTRLKPLVREKDVNKYTECTLTGSCFDVEEHLGGTFHAIHIPLTHGIVEPVDLGEYATKELAWQAIEDWRNSELSKHLSHDPSAGKDHEIDRLNADIRSLQSVIDRQKRTLDERLATMRDRQREINRLNQALAAYKGKEGGA